MTQLSATVSEVVTDSKPNPTITQGDSAYNSYPVQQMVTSSSPITESSTPGTDKSDNRMGS